MNKLQELDRAQRELDREKCRFYGHDTFTVTTKLGNGGAPVRVICDRCRQSWHVAPDATTTDRPPVPVPYPISAEHPPVDFDG